MSPASFGVRTSFRGLGGEEFVILCPQTVKVQAAELVEAILLSVSGLASAQVVEPRCAGTRLNEFMHLPRSNCDD